MIFNDLKIIKIYCAFYEFFMKHYLTRQTNIMTDLFNL